MKKIFSIVYGKYRTIKNHKTSYIFEKKLVISIICSKYDSKDEKVFKEEKSIEILKIYDLINNIEKYQKGQSDWRKHKSRI